VENRESLASEKNKLSLLVCFELLREGSKEEVVFVKELLATLSELRLDLRVSGGGGGEVADIFIFTEFRQFFLVQCVQYRVQGNTGKGATARRSCS
jgi:hypothetical protein